MSEIKLPVNFYQLPMELCDSMLNVTRSMHPHKAPRDFIRLKDQRAEKRIKDEISLQHSMEKASADHVKLIFFTKDMFKVIVGCL